MKISKLGGIFLLALFAVTFTSCDKDDEEEDVMQDPPEEEEVITTIRLTMTPAAGGDNVVWTFTDLDGDGGDDPVIDSPTPLAAGTTYTGSVEFLNETEDPAEDVTEEIQEEDEEHQVFYLANNVDMSVIYADMDENMNPIGLATGVVASSASTGTLQVILRHEPDKGAAGVSDGDITNAGGETDIEVEFSVTIQ